MTESIQIPEQFCDLKDLLSKDGIASGNTWYHGTTSGLVKSINNQGLKGGGDQAWIKRTQGTLKTIGNRTFENEDPVFLTQSKELAYFWAQQRTHARNLYFKNDESPALFEISLPESDNNQVRPDAGGAALVLEPGNTYLTFIKARLKDLEQPLDEFDALSVDRQFYLQQLGLAYHQASIAEKYVTLLTDY